MFTLIKYCVRKIQHIPERNILIVGLDNAGYAIIITVLSL